MARSKLGAGGSNEAGHIISSGNPAVNNMTGTNAIVAVIDIDEADVATFDISWTGTPVGAFKFEVSNSYIPNPKDLSGVTVPPIRAGKWTDVTATLSPAIVQPAGSANNIFVAFGLLAAFMGATWMRITYTNASGTGQLDVYLSGGAIGG